MKVRNFYPIAAIRKLAHKSTMALTASESAAFVFAARKSRKLGLPVVASAIQSNANIRIFLKEV